jgi:hypothetical protein
MSSALLFDLVFKMAMTAAIVVVASVAVERSGAFIGALIAALPTAAGAVYIILALEHPPSFIAASATGTIAANAAVAVFALAYAMLAQRHGIALCISVATLLWFAAASLLHLVELTPWRALAINAVVFAVTIPASARYRGATVAKESIKRAPYDLPLRAAAAAVVVAIVTAASHHIGSFASGMLALFPIVMGTFVVILHWRLGGPAAAAVFAHAQLPLVGLSFGFLAVHYLAEPVGVWWAYAAGLAVAVAWSGALWFFRRRS